MSGEHIHNISVDEGSSFIHSPAVGNGGNEAQLTVRSCAVGLAIGVMLCFTNMYFGLQTGWVTMGSIQAAVVGFAIFHTCWPKGKPFGVLENCVLQTVSVATATMPLAAGFVGIVPALAMLDPPVVLNIPQQLAWCAALSYFGIFFAVPLRRQTILVEQLPFPSGTATAKLLELLHAQGDGGAESEAELRAGWRALTWAFLASLVAAFVGFFIPGFANMRVGNWIGLPTLTLWHWTLRPSLSYVGQGMIMGPRSAFSMLAGAITSWVILGPLAKAKGWAPGDIDDWENGAQGWVLWVSIGLMLSESLASFALIVGSQALLLFRGGSGAEDVSAGAGSSVEGDPLEVCPPSQLVPRSWWLGGSAASIALCAAVLSPMFEIPPWQSIIGILLSCLVAILAVRALGQTDLNPVSGVGKLSQVIFAAVAPGHAVTNIVAGALAEAAAQQAGDLLQTMKAGHLLRASPRAQFYGQIIGSTASVLVTVAVYQLYDVIYGIPSKNFPTPVAYIWVDMAMLMQEGLGALPSSALYFAAGFAVLGAISSILEACLRHEVTQWMPSGMAFGIGMYLTPDWTLPRAAGALVVVIWRRRSPESYSQLMLMVASGFVLGEGIESIVALFLTAFHVPTFGS